MMGTRRFIVGRAESGRTVEEFLAAHLRFAKPAAQRLVRERQVRLAGTPCLDPARRVRTGQHVEVRVRTPEGGAAGRTHPRAARKGRERLAPGSWAPVVRYADEHV